METFQPACCRSGSLGPKSWAALRSLTFHSPVLHATLQTLLPSELNDGVRSPLQPAVSPGRNTVVAGPDTVKFAVTFHLVVA